MKKHDEKSAPTTVVETDATPSVEIHAVPGRLAIPLDAPLGSKLDGITDAAIRDLVSARLRLIEANLLDRLEPSEAAIEVAAAPDAAPDADLAKARAIAAQLKKKPQA